MDRLAAMEAFVRVVERGGFTAAAEELRLSRAMVSKHVQDLEEHLGARLLNRTTRKVSLTEAGRVYYERSLQLLADLAETEEAVGELQARPRGRLRVNAPVSFGALHLAAAVADYMAAYPEVTVELTLNDRIVDLVEEGYDLALRIARLTDSSLIARRLAPCRMAVCASPAYLGRAGQPEHPDDLTRHNCLGYSYGQARDEWRFDGPEGAASVRVRGTLQANNGDALRAAALRGAGLVLLPSFIVGADLTAGRLVPVLSGYRVPELGIHAVYPHSRHLSAKVRSFVDFLVPRYGETPTWDAWMSGPEPDRRAGTPVS
ncbi:MAG: LysR family transcriptional regulator [Acidimicrobiia bacterium]|nr:LysR family transcriptional regulator [Acidimicrobiia bacterium]